MTEKPVPFPKIIVSNLINKEMNKAEKNPLAMAMFEIAYAKEGYRLDWNKRLNKNCEWVNKKELQE